MSNNENLSNKYGLTTKEAAELLRKYGKNEIKNTVNILPILLNQFKNGFVILLLAVSVISYILNLYEDAAIILIVVFLHAILGFYQEYKSQKIAQKLSEKLESYAFVLRDNKWVKLEVKNIVPNDYVKVEAGTRIPADGKIIKAVNFSVDESILTGESFPVNKKEHDKVFASTFVTSGYAEIVITETGINTYIGKTLSYLTTRKETAFERNVNDLSNKILILSAISVFIIFIINIFTKKSIVETALFSIVLAVGLVPEAFPLVVTFTLALSVNALAKHGLLVKRLSSVEMLGNVDVLCIDKTGTITENQIKVQDFIKFNKKEKEFIEIITTLCIENISDIKNKKRDEAANFIDSAILAYAREKGLDKEWKNYDIIAEVPFDFSKRRVSIIVKDKRSNETFIISKGSFESMIEISTLNKEQKEKAREIFVKYSNDGFRVLAVAYKNLGNSLKEINEENARNIIDSYEGAFEFLGFILLLDPPKKGVKYYIEYAKTLGIDIKVISGDNANIVKYTAKNVGINFDESQVLTGYEIKELKNDWEKFKAKVKECVIFASIYPEQKQLIIKALKEQGHVVAFLGDGINDVLALREADVGISVNNAQDVTKEVSEVILLKKSLSSIINAIVGGRKAFSNVVKYLNSTFVGNFSNLFVVGLVSPFLQFLPLRTVQILLVNFLTDLPLFSIATDNVEDDELIKPKRWDVEGIILISLIFGLLATIFNLILLFAIANAEEKEFTTMLFLYLLFSGIFVIFNLRALKPFYKAELPSKELFLMCLFALIFGTLLVYLSPSIFYFTPLDKDKIMFIILISLLFFISSEILKFFYTGFIRREVVIDKNDKKALNVIRKKIPSELH